jgi:hypothetical protein
MTRELLASCDENAHAIPHPRRRLSCRDLFRESISAMPRGVSTTLPGRFGSDGHDSRLAAMTHAWVAPRAASTGKEAARASRSILRRGGSAVTMRLNRAWRLGARLPVSDRLPGGREVETCFKTRCSSAVFIHGASAVFRAKCGRRTAQIARFPSHPTTLPSAGKGEGRHPRPVGGARAGGRSLRIGRLVIGRMADARQVASPLDGTTLGSFRTLRWEANED